MPTIGVANPTLADLARRLDPNGTIAQVVEQLTQTNEILLDMTWIEGNLPTGHKTTVRTGLPTPTWRKLNYGVQPSKSHTAQVVDTCGMLEAYGQVDKELAEINGNSAAWRLSEEAPFIESFNQEVAKTIFYGDTDVYPERFLGLAPRYKNYQAVEDKTKSTYNVINAGGTGSDNTSIWFVVWGPNTVHGIVPKGSEAGLKVKDLGEQTLLDANGNPYQGYRTHYQWKCGLTVRDWRYVVRIANIDVSDLKTAGTGSDVSANLVRLMILAKHRIPVIGAGRAAIYANETVKTFLEVQAISKANAALTYTEAAGGGGPITRFQGIPIRRCDAILDTEAALTPA